MRQKNTFKILWILLITGVISMNFAFGFANQLKNDTAYFRIKNKTAPRSYLKGGFHISFPSIKALVSPSSKAGMAKPADDKLLSNVQITTPVTDQINLKYTISRNSLVSIKVMDVLGNNVLTLLSQRVDPGEKIFSYNLNRQLTSGFYFIRFVAGNESVIKRISVL